MSNDWNSQQASYKDLKLNARSNKRTSEGDGQNFFGTPKEDSVQGQHARK